MNTLTNQTTKGKILALKEEYERQLKNFQEDNDKAILYNKSFTRKDLLKKIVKDLEELIK